MITKLNFTDHTIKSYAIRKLTPKECFRLMGVRDNALFMQFDLPPTHEAAMFLKTWLTLRMNTLNGWERELDELRNCIENERDVLNSDFASFSEYHTFPCEGFEELFKENMERKKDEN